MWIPDGPWSDVMSFLLMNKEDFEERKEIEHYKQMTPTNLHFDNPELCDHAYNICRKLKSWNVTHKCCDKRGFMVHDNTYGSMRMRTSFSSHSS
jgi:hypothetical protein